MASAHAVSYTHLDVYKRQTDKIRYKKEKAFGVDTNASVIRALLPSTKKKHRYTSE